LDIGLPSLSLSVKLPFPDIEIGLPELPNLPTIVIPSCPFED
jgi:hypothetical protein